jgi:hypothetical protein
MCCCCSCSSWLLPLLLGWMELLFLLCHVDITVWQMAGKGISSTPAPTCCGSLLLPVRRQLQRRQQRC